MKCIIPEISWHNRDPVLSVDIQPVDNKDFYRLASGGADFHVLVWHLKTLASGSMDITVVSDLNRHQRAVNCVRWSPSGQYLASGSDDASIILWNLKTDNIPPLDGETTDQESWIVNKILRGHKEDVYDLSWSPDGTKLISGSIDNTAILWDINKGINEQILSDHKGFVQGVSWDPKGQLIATLGSDRICRIFNNTGKQVKARIYRGCLPLESCHSLYKKEVKYFYDDTFKSYFRRLTFSPDGNLLLTPSGYIDVEDCNSAKNVTYVFTLDSLEGPSILLPSPKKITVAVRCCPILFQLHDNGCEPYISLPYRMIIAIATESDIVLYDTQQFLPFAHFQNIHYTRITDITWSLDGHLLTASSSDGFCTIITFDIEELGVPYIKEDSDTEEMDVSINEEIEKEVTEKAPFDSIKVKKRTILEQWTIRKPKGDIPKEESCSKMAETSVSCESDTLSHISVLSSPEIVKSENSKIERNVNDNNTTGNAEKSVITKITETNKAEVLVDNKYVEQKPPGSVPKRIKPKNLKRSKESIKRSKVTRTNSLATFFKSNREVKKHNMLVKSKRDKKLRHNKEIVVVEISDDSNSLDSKMESPSITNNLCNKDINLKPQNSAANDQQSTTQNELKENESMKCKESITVENLEPAKPTVAEESKSTASESSINKLATPTARKIPRRIPFITLSSPKQNK